MNALAVDEPCPRERHRTLDFIGLRAHATTVGLIQLCEELLKAGVIDMPALERIKDAIRKELTVSNARIAGRDDFDATLRRRIDAIFPKAPGEPPEERVGPLEHFEDVLGSYHGA